MAKTSQSPQIPRQRPYRRADLIDRYAINEATLWRWVQDGVVPEPSFRLGRVPYWDLADIEAAEERHRGAARAG